ncbi:hypothetical protein [Nostoc sp. 'Peltigera membranacea cyanobiont' 210A]|uniref:hypothetical protein n=1 Tax=Nostoc sp. 'Peltigera membranacea cyanobiont' 210A TaxID=2014529 RepID=UPI00167DD7FA|nr:hypothetical protein [Nostoc sp. 'Peltigera membranacea cyanobiont' 210A]
MAINPKSLRVGQSLKRSSVANYGNRPSGSPLCHRRKAPRRQVDSPRRVLPHQNSKSNG